MIKIPFSLLPKRVLENRSNIFIGIGEILQNIFPFLELNLKRANFEGDSRKYLSMCFLTSLTNLILLMTIGTFALFIFDYNNYYLWGPAGSLVIIFFMFFQQVSYPKVFANRKIRSVERNLLSILAICTLAFTVPTLAAEGGHKHHPPASSETEDKVSKKNSKSESSNHVHDDMGNSTPATTEAMDHEAMDHEAMDHEAMGHEDMNMDGNGEHTNMMSMDHNSMRMQGGKPPADARDPNPRFTVPDRTQPGRIYRLVRTLNRWSPPSEDQELKA